MVMSKFDPAISYLLPNEGGWTNDPNDHGGCTNFGLTLADCLLFPEFGIHSCEDLRHISMDIVRKIYYATYWHYGNVADQRVATKIFDTAVNVGVGMGAKIAQRAVNQCGVSCAVDGQWGPKTETAINSAAPDKLLPSLVANLKAYYRKIVDNNPSQAKFLNGWLDRAERLPK